MKHFTAIPLLIIIACCLAPHDTLSKSPDAIYCSDADRCIIQKILNKASAEKWNMLSLADITVKTGLHLTGTPYEGYTLEIVPEQLVVNMRGLDCVTFVETCIAAALTVRSQNPSFEAFAANLQIIRYEDGVIDGYASRLHYTSHWIIDNSEKGILHEVTPGLHSELWHGTINSMSMKRSRIKQMQDANVYSRIIATEKMLNSRQYQYIPSQKIPAFETMIRSGDVIAFTSGPGGDDVKHVGFAYIEGGRLLLLHASSDSRIVEVTSETLSSYVSARKNFTGIRVVRLN